MDNRMYKVTFFGIAGSVSRTVHTERKRTRKQKRPKNNRKRSKKKFQTLKKIFVFAFAPCERILKIHTDQTLQIQEILSFHRPVNY